MLKVSPVLSDTPTQSLPPLVDSCVNDVLVKLAQFCNQSFCQMVDVTGPAKLDSLLHDAPDRVVNRIEVRAVRWPVLWTEYVAYCYRYSVFSVCVCRCVCVLSVCLSVCWT